MRLGLGSYVAQLFRICKPLIPGWNRLDQPKGISASNSGTSALGVDSSFVASRRSIWWSGLCIGVCFCHIFPTMRHRDCIQRERIVPHIESLQRSPNACYLAAEIPLRLNRSYASRLFPINRVPLVHYIGDGNRDRILGTWTEPPWLRRASLVQRC